MRIKSVTLHGFKSFADRTRIDLHEGMTSIVGPNGCGKSNISDALRWVLGEQRPSAIRGSRMEEAIFQGTAARKPIQRAEVELVLGNEDGILPVPYTEVVIGRTVLRGGESVYSLNGATCRLRDILDLCRDTGLGANAYSIIEGRMVDAILSDRAEERRALFEEAAEVGRYKDRRRTALRRLDQAEQDLMRLEDVLGEVRTKVRSLGRQRGRARRFEELREERLQLEVAVAEGRLGDLERRLGEAERELSGLRQVAPEQEARVASLETAAEAMRLRLLEHERERSGVARQLEEVRTRLEEIERIRLVAGERVATAEARIAAIEAEQALIVERRGAISAEVGEIEASLDSAAADLEALHRREAEREAHVEELRQLRREGEEKEQEALAALAVVIRELGGLEAESEGRKERDRARRIELERRREEVRQAVERADDLVRRVEAARAAESELAGRRAEAERELEAAGNLEREALTALREAQRSVAERERELASLEARHEGLAAAVAAGRDLPATVAALIGDLGESEGVLGVLSAFMDVPAEHVAAVEACLGSLLHGVVVRDWDAVVAVRRWLEGRKGAEGVFLLPIDPGPRGGTDARGGLADRVGARAPAVEWIRALISGVEPLASGDFRLRDEPWVAADGSGQDRLGIIRVGHPGAARGVMRRRTELAALTEEAGSHSRDLARRRKALRTLEEAAERRVAERRAAEQAAEKAESARRRAQAERETVEEQLRRTRTALGSIEERIADLETSLAEEKTAAGVEMEVEKLRQRRVAAEARLTEERAKAAEAVARWEEEQAELQDLRQSVARLDAAQAARAERLRGTREQSSELEERAAALDRESKVQRGAILAARESVEGTEDDVAGLLEQRRELGDRHRIAEEEQEERRAELERLEADLREARRLERGGSERRHALELEVAETRGQRATVRERLEAEWEASFEDLRKRVEAPEEGDLASWEERLETVRAQLAGIGPVNLLAAREYDEERERLDFLEEQRKDLERARQDLLDSIRRINETASASFLAVFEQVRANFHRIFVTLFEGGECDVWLEDPADPLDSPIEISASPRGKRTQRIHLLSGGERALTALALLFAIYLAKPSPFCVMDEVDAPLDDANIGRFTAMLEKFKVDTQFVVITHNPRTIEAADWIYGVTMQEPGVSSLVAVELQDLPRGQVA